MADAARPDDSAGDDVFHGFMASSFQNSYAVGAVTTQCPQFPQEMSMREFFRPVLAALSIALLAASVAAISTSAAQAQAKDAPAQAAQDQPPAIKQIALTDKQIDAVLASQKDMDVITDKLPENAQPDPKVIAQLEAVAKKHGFAGYDDYNNVIDNISLVLGGIDPATKRYVGSEAVIKSQIALVEADKKMNANEKKQALENLNMALKAKEPAIENKGNIDLVVKYYDKLTAVLGEDNN
jgi:conjugal transfer/entry exclusion protein